METNKLRNVAKFFAHLLYTDALPWTCLETIRLSEDATTSSSRIFIKILVLVRCLGLDEVYVSFHGVFVFGGISPVALPRGIFCGVLALALLHGGYRLSSYGLTSTPASPQNF